MVKRGKLKGSKVRANSKRKQKKQGKEKEPAMLSCYYVLFQCSIEVLDRPVKVVCFFLCCRCFVPTLYSPLAILYLPIALFQWCEAVLKIISA
jgi:hypothetical protein